MFSFLSGTQEKSNDFVQLQKHTQTEINFASALAVIQENQISAAHITLLKTPAFLATLSAENIADLIQAKKDRTDSSWTHFTAYREMIREAILNVITRVTGEAGCDRVARLVHFHDDYLRSYSGASTWRDSAGTTCSHSYHLIETALIEKTISVCNPQPEQKQEDYCSESVTELTALMTKEELNILRILAIVAKNQLSEPHFQLLKTDKFLNALTVEQIGNLIATKHTSKADPAWEHFASYRSRIIVPAILKFIARTETRAVWNEIQAFINNKRGYLSHADDASFKAIQNALNTQLIAIRKKSPPAVNADSLRYPTIGFLSGAISEQKKPPLPASYSYATVTLGGNSGHG